MKDTIYASIKNTDNEALLQAIILMLAAQEDTEKKKKRRIDLRTLKVSPELLAMTAKCDWPEEWGDRKATHIHHELKYGESIH